MNDVTMRISFGRRLLSWWLDFVVTAGIGYLAMWPLGIFEHESAYADGQVLLRILLLALGSFIVANGWLLLRQRLTWGKKFAGIGREGTRALPWWNLTLRAFAVMIIAALPFALLIVRLIN